MIERKITSERAILLVILLAGTLLRLWNVGWGLPELHEEATPLVKAWGMWNWHGPGIDLNPHFFNYPALTFYLLFVAQGIQYLIGHILGIYPNLQSFVTTLGAIAIPARVIIGLLDVGTIWITYMFAKEVSDWKIALIAAWLVAINPLHVTQAHYITVDTPLTFFVVISLLFMYRSYSRPAQKWYLLSGICIGLAAATKYTGAFLLIVLFVLHLMRSRTLADALRSIGDRGFILGLMASLVVFLMINPYILISYDEFIKDFSFEQYHAAAGHLGVESSQATVDFYLLGVLPSGIGWLLSLLVPVTVLLLIVRKETSKLLLLLFPVIYTTIMSTWELRADRYLLPVFPVTLLICSIGMSALWELIRSGIDRFTSKAVRIGFATILGGFLVVQPILNVYRFQQSIVLPDTRTVAKTWVEQRFRPTSAIATGPFGITLQDTNYNLLIIPFLAVNPERTAPFYDSRWYEDFDLLIASDYDYSRYARDPEKYGSFLPYYDSLRSRWKLLSEIKPEEHQLGPTLWFYTYPDSMRRNRFEPSLFEKLQGSIESTRVSSFLNKLGEVLLQKQKLEKSGQVMRQILSVEVDNVRIRNTLAQVLHSIGDDRGALLEVQRSLRTNPTQAELFGFAGDLLLSLGRSQEAELSYLKALQLNKYLNIAYTRLIAFYTERKDQTKLKNILERYYGVLPPRSDEAMRIRNELERLRGSS